VIEARSEWRNLTAELARRLQSVFEALLAWCDLEDSLADRRPAPGEWTAREVLEHVHLADHHLLLLAEKAAVKSARRVARREPWPQGLPGPDPLRRLGERSLVWPHPVHMTPAGERALSDTAADLQRDRVRCLALLAAMPEGQGTLHTIRMSLIDARLDLYGWLGLIAVHGERHLRQLERGPGARAGGG